MMSDITNFLDSKDSEDQLSIALKMIISSFESQTQASNSHITHLSDELTKSNLLIEELQRKLHISTQSKEEYKEQLTSLKQQNKQLNKKIEELTNENATLKNIRNMPSVDNPDKRMPSIENSPSFLHSSVKFCKPQKGIIENQKNNSRLKSLDMSITGKLVDSKRQMQKNQSFSNLNSLSMLSHNNSFKSSSKIASTPQISAIVLNGEGYNVENKNPKNSVFFNNCRKTIDNDEYREIIDIVRSFNLRNLTKQDTYQRISKILQYKYPELLEEFQKLFILPNN